MLIASAESTNFHSCRPPTHIIPRAKDRSGIDRVEDTPHHDYRRVPTTSSKKIRKRSDASIRDNKSDIQDIYMSLLVYRTRRINFIKKQDAS